MGTTSTISSKGQITIPVEIRKRLGVKEGDRVEFVVDEGRTVLRPVVDEVNPFDKWAGRFPAFGSIEEVNAWVREMRDGNEE